MKKQSILTATLTTRQFKIQNSKGKSVLVTCLSFLIFNFSFLIVGFSQSIGINTTGAVPVPSAMLDIANANKGLLIPRVSLTSTTDITTIASPANSLLVYNTNATMTGGAVGYWYYNTSIPAWVQLLNGGSPGTAWLLLGNTATTAGTNFIGTTDAKDLVFKTNNTEWMRILSTGNVGIGTTVPENRLHAENTENTVGIVSVFQTARARSSGTPLVGDGVGVEFQNQHDLGEPAVLSARIASLVEQVGPSTVRDANLVFHTQLDGSVTEKMRITGSGNVGIGTTAPTSLLSVNGAADNTTGVWGLFSDQRLKKNIHSLEGALETLTKLQGVKFHWKDSKKDSVYGEVMGFIAQDVEKVIPRWVKTSNDGYKMLETTGINALLVEAIKEQQKIIEEQKKQNEEQNQNIQILNEELHKVKILISSQATK